MGVHGRRETQVQTGECLVKRGGHGRKVAGSRGTPKIAGTTVCSGAWGRSLPSVSEETGPADPLSDFCPPELRDNEFLLF